MSSHHNQPRGVLLKPTFIYQPGGRFRPAPGCRLDLHLVDVLNARPGDVVHVRANLVKGGGWRWLRGVIRAKRGDLFAVEALGPVPAGLGLRDGSFFLVPADAVAYLRSAL